MSRKRTQLSRCCSLLIGAALALAAFDWAAAQSNQPTPNFDFGRGDDALELAVADARADQDGVWVQLSPKSGNDFGAFTQKHMDEVIDILVDGQVLYSPIVRSPILGGRMQLVRHIEFERAWTMALRLKTGNAKLVVRVDRLAPH
jgi:preprotein translocase subunit SecD